MLLLKVSGERVRFKKSELEMLPYQLNLAKIIWGKISSYYILYKEIPTAKEPLYTKFVPGLILIIGQSQ